MNSAYHIILGLGSLIELIVLVLVVVKENFKISKVNLMHYLLCFTAGVPFMCAMIINEGLNETNDRFKKLAAFIVGE